MSAMRPDISAGPMPRSSSPLKVSAFMRDPSASSASLSLAFFAATIETDRQSRRKSTVIDLVVFIFPPRLHGRHEGGRPRSDCLVCLTWKC